MNEYKMIFGNDEAFCYGNTPEEAFRDLDPLYKIATKPDHLILVDPMSLEEFVRIHHNEVDNG